MEGRYQYEKKDFVNSKYGIKYLSQYKRGINTVSEISIFNTDKSFICRTFYNVG